MKDTETYGECLTVGELIEKLKAFDTDMPVLAEGCDCLGGAYDVEVEKDWQNTSFVLVARKPHR